jgi:hypothetical protein
VRVVKTFSLDKERDLEILKFINHHENASGYIRNLIRMDLGLVPNTVYDKLLERFLAKYNLTSIQQAQQEVAVVDFRPDSRDLSEIQSIMNME